MDGIEYRIISEVTKNWKVHYNLRMEVGQEKDDPYIIALNDVRAGVSDLAMCSMWLNYDHYSEHDLTTFFYRQCITFLVPVNKLISEGSTIYISLSIAVWSLYVGSLVIVGLVVNQLARIYSHFINKQFDTFSYLSECYMDLVNIATSHGIQRFPTSIALKIIVIW